MSFFALSFIDGSFGGSQRGASPGNEGKAAEGDGISEVLLESRRDQKNVELKSSDPLLTLHELGCTHGKFTVRARHSSRRTNIE
jgi:hypothetical protein